MPYMYIIYACRFGIMIRPLFMFEQVLKLSRLPEFAFIKAECGSVHRYHHWILLNKFNIEMISNTEFILMITAASITAVIASLRFLSNHSTHVIIEMASCCRWSLCRSAQRHIAFGNCIQIYSRL